MRPSPRAHRDRLLIQYWWGLLIALGVVVVTVALVRVATAPPRPARVRPPRPARPPKPRTVRAPPGPALLTDDLADQMRAAKQDCHIREMQDWDYEWLRLTNPEKSNSRHLDEIAKPISRGGGRSASIIGTLPALDSAVPNLSSQMELAGSKSTTDGGILLTATRTGSHWSRNSTNTPTASIVSQPTPSPTSTPP